MAAAFSSGVIIISGPGSALTKPQPASSRGTRAAQCRPAGMDACCPVQDAAETRTHQEAAAAAAAAATGAQTSSGMRIMRRLIWFHHIKSVTKRKVPADVESSLELGHCSMRGLSLQLPATEHAADLPAYADHVLAKAGCCALASRLGIVSLESLLNLLSFAVIAA